MPPTDQEFKRNLEQLVDSPWTIWWINYLGSVAALVAAIYPAGVCDSRNEDRLKIKTSWRDDSKGKQQLLISVRFGSEIDSNMFSEELKDIEKVGKKKNWIGGKDGCGYKVTVVLESLHDSN